MSTETVKAARIYFGCGFMPLPVRNGKNPGMPQWEKFRVQQNEIEKKFSPVENIGLLLGAPSGGLVDVDLDCAEARALAPLFLPKTHMRGGRKQSRDSHYFYKCADVQTVRYQDPDISHNEERVTLVELRSTGAQTLVHPSKHPSGDLYEWSNGGKLDPPTVSRESLEKDVRRLAACCLIARRWRNGIRHELTLALSGGLLRAGWNQQQVEDFICAAARGAGDDELEDRRAAIATTFRKLQGGGLATGIPRLADIVGVRAVEKFKEWLELPARPRTAEPTPTVSSNSVRHTANESATNIYGEPLEYLEREVDEGFAQLFVSLQKHRVRFCSDNSKWFFFDGTRWKVDEAAVRRLAVSVSKYYARLALEADDMSRQKDLLKLAGRLLSDRYLRIILNLASKHLTIKLTDFDQCQDLLNLPNGTLNLRTGELQQHSPEDLITCLCPVEWRTDVGCDRWTVFLEEVFCEEYSLINFAQKLAGLSLTGDVRERIFILLTGSGANGKSVFLSTLAGLLGPDYAKVAAPELLLGADTREQSHELAGLRSMRLVVASETGKNRRLNEALIKRVTGKDIISARALYTESIQFKPQFLMWLSTNNRPSVSETTNAIWDRIKEIPFDRTFAPEEQDKNLDQALAEEYSGILKWAYDGYRAYLAEGLAEPDRVTQAVASFRAESDQVGNFISQQCETGKGFEVEPTALYIAYREWCEKVGEPSEKQNAFARQLTALGLPIVGVGRKARRAGIKLAVSNM